MFPHRLYNKYNALRNLNATVVSGLYRLLVAPAKAQSHSLFHMDIAAT